MKTRRCSPAARLAALATAALCLTGGLFGQRPASSEGNTRPDGPPLPRPPILWQLSSASDNPRAVYAVDVRELTSVTLHSYLIEGGFRVWEVNASDQSPLAFRAYAMESPTPTDEKATSGRTDAPGTGARVSETAVDQKPEDKVIKIYPVATHAKTVEVRLAEKNALLSLHESLWKSFVRHEAGGYPTEKPPANTGKSAGLNGGPVWEFQAPGGHYSVRLDRISSLSWHSYLIEGGSRVTELNLGEHAASHFLRIYAIASVGASDDAAAPARTSANVAAGKITEAGSRQEPWEKIVKDYPVTTHAHTVEFRVSDASTVKSVFSQALAAWSTQKGGRFTIAPSATQLPAPWDEAKKSPSGR